MVQLHGALKRVVTAPSLTILVVVPHVPSIVGTGIHLLLLAIGLGFMFAHW